MKKLLIIPALLFALASCKNDKDPNTTTVTTEEETTVDTISNKVRTETVVTETTKTDSTEHSISTGGVKVETKAENADRLKEEEKAVPKK